MDKIFFDSWDSIIRTLLITSMAYPIMIFLLRISGKRTLSQMNAFDFIITVALGSAFATVTLNKDITLADGALVFALLIFMQYVVTWLSVRNKSVKKIVSSDPTLLLYKGQVLEDVLKKQRITVEEIYVAARKKGISELEKIDAVILETTGDITIVSDVDRSAETMSDVEKQKSLL